MKSLEESSDQATERFEAMQHNEQLGKETYGVVANGFSLSTASKELIVPSDFSIYPERKVALVGRNGGGKTSLLEVIAALSQGKEPPEYLETSGNVTVLPATRVGYLPQNIQIDFGGSVEEYLDRAATSVSQAYAEYEDIVKQLEHETSPSLIEKLGELIEKMDSLNAWDFPRMKTAIVQELGLDAAYMKRSMREISGGQATRVALAGVLLTSPNLLLLDEPTNNLDPKAAAFLEKWIKETKCAAIIVSHDRAFLDNVIDETLEIDEQTPRIKLYGGNYSFYRSQKEKEFQSDLLNYEEQERKKQALQRAAENLKARARESEATSHDSFYREKAKRVARQAKAQEKRIERELNSLLEPEPPKRPTIPVASPEVLEGKMASLEDVSFSYEKGSKVVSDIDLDIYGTDRIALIGPNGVGKTTLIRIVAGELTQFSGRFSLLPDAHMAYLPQYLQRAGDPGANLVEYFRNRAPVSYERAIALLKKVIFQDPQKLRLGDFSIGELRRIELAAMFATNPNFIVMDEPTNYLDLFTIEMLEDALQQYNGGLLVCSHDVRFLSGLNANKVCVFSSPRQLETKNIDSSDDLRSEYSKCFGLSS